jgi:hypothetical protein
MTNHSTGDRRPINAPPTPTVDRRTVLRQAAALGLLAGPAAGLLAACSDDRDAQSGMDGGMPDWMMGDGMMDAAMMSDMRVIHDLLTAHAKIRREVEDIDSGIRSRTTSDDPQLADLIRNHVQAMRARIEDNRPIRHGDPLFREIFEHHAAISLDAAELPDGVQVTETSTDPQVQLLIRQHAHKAVSEFVASGMQRAMRPTPLPDGYRG